MIISVALATILAVVILVISLFALNLAFTTFARDSKRVRAYAMRYQQIFGISQGEQPITAAKTNKAKSFWQAKIKTQLLDRDWEPDEKEESEGAAYSRNDRIKFLQEASQRRARWEVCRMLGRLPPPFAIIDHLVFLVKRAWTNSLKEFYR